MLSKDEALAAAKSFLDGTYANDPKGWVMVVVAERSYRYRDGWIAYFNTQEGIDSGNHWVGPISKILIVPDEGSPYFSPTHATSEQFREFCETGIWPVALRMPR
ncbi:YrhB domain-containing protein [Streptomyces sp. NPDC020875]|uniref:YrhB domain-containing protein n=1 Tax=Streptomyces sp. NPDC020875 TaxID=3154898 RepID=UPI0033DDA7B4